MKSLICLVISGSASATTYYIAANGSDSNSGTAKTTPWAHAPGMPNCANVCASAAPKPGDQFIFRGGDTWHFGSGTPLIGGVWTWQWSGVSGSPIYVGVDSTWYSGTTFARPILSGDNPQWTGTGFPASCAYADSGDQVALGSGSLSYVTFDNFEFTGFCWTGNVQTHGTMLDVPGGDTHIVVSNNYCHGWTMTSGADDNFPCVTSFGSGTVQDFNRYTGNVFDGSDSPHFPSGDTTHCQYPGLTTDGCASGQGMNGSHFYDLDRNVFRYLSNDIVTGNCHSIHDNLFEYLYDTFASGSYQQHPNVMNCLGGATGESVYWYNNVIRHTYVTEDVYLAVRTSAYIFNNVFFDNMNSVFGSLPAGFFRLNAVSNSTLPVSAYIYNNTLDNTGQFIFDQSNAPLTAWDGNGYFRNNHVIGWTSMSSVYTCHSGATCTFTDSGNEILQSPSTAAAQGYTAANNYAPTSGSGSTVGAGANLSSSCGTFSADNAFCSGTSDGVLEQSGDGGQVPKYPAVTIEARPSSTGWDVGAYLFSAGGSGPTPPTGLAAVVQ